MAATAVPARQTIAEEWWFRLIVRAILALLAMWALAFAANRFETFLANLQTSLWLAWIGPTVGAGLLFGLAAWLPFAKVRYLWSRLLLAALALAPLAQYWWVFVFQLTRHGEAGGWTYRWLPYWLLDQPTQTALAVLAGVAIASGFRAAGDRG